MADPDLELRGRGAGLDLYCKHSMTLMKHIQLDSIVFFAASLDISHTFPQVLERFVS